MIEENIDLSVIENKIRSLNAMYNFMSIKIDEFIYHKNRQIDENRKVSRKLDEILKLLSQASVQGKKCMECGEPKLRAKTKDGESYIQTCGCYACLEP